MCAGTAGTSCKPAVGLKRTLTRRHAETHNGGERVRELAPGVFTEMFVKLAAVSEVVTVAVLNEGARQVRDATRNSFVGVHAYGTPTPARRGGPPSRVSYALHEAMTFTAVTASTGGWQVHIGPRPGVFPQHGRTDSATYGNYMERGRSGRGHLAFPFLEPAFRRTMDAAHIATLFRAERWI